MKKTIYVITVTMVLLTIASLVLYHFNASDTAFTLAITFGTISYHFLMRLAVGFIVDAIMHNKADLTKKWYQCRAWEDRFYERLRVKRWKKLLPSFQPDYFDCRKHSWAEIAQAMCQSEVVHEIIVVLSFVPIVFSIRVGALSVFLLTSVFSALIDVMFVILQRYNRPRVIKLIGRQNPEH